MSAPRRPQVGSLSASLHGRAITITAVSPTTVVVHRVPARPEAWRPSVRHQVSLVISNPTAGDLSAEVHYNNGSVEVLIPSHDSRELKVTCEGDSPRCAVINASVSVSIISGQSGTITVAGGYEQL